MYVLTTRTELVTVSETADAAKPRLALRASVAPNPSNVGRLRSAALYTPYLREKARGRRVARDARATRDASERDSARARISVVAVLPTATATARARARASRPRRTHHEKWPRKAEAPRPYEPW